MATDSAQQARLGAVSRRFVLSCAFGAASAKSAKVMHGNNHGHAPPVQLNEKL
jgi:hypothetical protein